MESTVAVQTNGFGFSFQAARNSCIAVVSSSTLKNESRRMRFRRAPLGAQRCIWTVAYLNSTASTASKRNAVDMGLSRLAADAL
jgi:hypothetical protein